MAELESSLQAMDWLACMNVGKAISSSAKSEIGSTKVAGGHIAMRKGPNSPLDTNATYEDDSSQAVQHKDGKPPYSYANLITFAINSTTKKKMTLSEIYQWISENFPYYKDAGNGWKVGWQMLSRVLVRLLTTLRLNKYTYIAKFLPTFEGVLMWIKWIKPVAHSHASPLQPSRPL